MTSTTNVPTGATYRQPAVAALLATAALTLTACGSAAGQPDAAGPSPQPAAASHPSTAAAAPRATLRPGDPVPPPKGRVVLRIKGGRVHNVGNVLALDLDQLDAMGTVHYVADDAQATGRRATFSGPLVRTVLQVAGVTGARTMHTIALNDYAVDVPVSDAEDLPLMLATRMDGRRMSVANYGPTRFIYPTSGYHLSKAVYDPRWIWQLATVVVR